MPKFAANITMMFNELPFLDRIQAAADSGFKAVEFLFPYEHSAKDIANALARSDVQNVLFNMPPGDWNAGERGIAALPGRSEEFRAGVEKAIVYAQAFGTPHLHAMAGLRPLHADDRLCRATYIDNLKYAADQCAAQGINVLIEPINNRDMPGYFINWQEQAHLLREEVGAANLKVQMDFYHTQIMEGDITTTFQKFQQHIGHIQIASVPERHEPDTGEINYPYLFRMLDERNYDGWVGCEYRPAKGTKEGLGWMTAI